MKRGALSTSITLLVLITSLLLLGGGSLLMDARIDSRLEERYRETLLAQARAAATVIELESEVPQAHGLLRPLGELFGGHGRIYYELRCKSQPIVRSYPAPPLIPGDWPDNVSTEPKFSELMHEGRPLGSVIFAFQGAINESSTLSARPFVPVRAGDATHDCQLLFQQDRRQFDDLLLDIDWILVISPLLALFIAFIAVPLIIRRGMRPMAQLVQSMDRIGPSAPGQRLAPTGLSELDPLVVRFNQVLERMDDGLARERQFASGLAHETRTRLAELRTLTEVELRYPTGRSMHQLLSEIGVISGELEATVTALLMLTRLQAGMDLPQPQRLDLAEWLERLVQRHRVQRDGASVVYDLQVADAPVLHTDPALLELVIGNLIGNAFAYAPKGDRVLLCANRMGFHIENAAPNLNASDMPHLGQRFWRKQTEQGGHAGLGLALAMAAAQVLGMPLELSLSPEHRLHANLAWHGTRVH